jgi:LmbE family N-acetylglucosaminyl deacetylase
MCTRPMTVSEESEEAAPGRALAIVAHPDDLEFPAGGTVAGWVDQGWQVSLCVVTDGQRGTAGSSKVNRRAEQQAAARALGIEDVIFLGGMDTEVEATRALRRTLAGLIRRVRPSRVITHSPRYAWTLPMVNHPDHRAVGECALDAVYPQARTEGPADAGLSPWAVQALWLFGDQEANHVEDVTAHLPAKLAALRCHRSQFTGDSVEELELRRRMAQTAVTAGMGPERLAERFQVLSYS